MRRITLILALAAEALSACGSDSTPTNEPAKVTPTATATRTQAPTPVRKQYKAQAKPKPTPTAAPKAPAFVACDSNIKVRAATTSCGLAQSTFYEYSQDPENVRAYSLATGQWYAMDCYVSSAVVCKGGDGGEVHFLESAVAAYTYENAVTYASSHKVNLSPDREESYTGDPAPTEDYSDDSDIY